jgi:membrane-associated phospholipid phosphatase
MPTATADVLSVAFIAWVLLTAGRASVRLEILRALVVALALAELIAQAGKLLANQPRPLAVIEGLDTHGYPVEPHGNAYPSAHTALLVAAVCALWPWMRWPQRIVGVATAAWWPATVSISAPTGPSMSSGGSPSACSPAP